MADVKKVVTLDECKKHMTQKSCWIVIHGKVYDVTTFLEEHPGGFDIIITSTGALGLAPSLVTLVTLSINCGEGLTGLFAVSGKDATQDFEEIGHSNSAKQLLEKYYLGEFKVCPSVCVEWERGLGADTVTLLCQHGYPELQGGDSAPAKKAVAKAPTAKASASPSIVSRAVNVMLPFLLIGVAIILHYFFEKKAQK